MTSPGFGSGPFGSGPFGTYDWARQVLYRDWPSIDKRLDSEVANESLKKWTESMGPLFEEVLTFTRDFDQIRDPDSIRTQFQDNISITIASAAIEQPNRTVRVEVVDPDPSDPLVPLGRASVGWILKDADGREFTVNEVHKLSAAFTVTGNIIPTAGAAVLRPPALIGYLGEDYGLTIDQHDAEVFQRCFARNAFQWLSLKGNQRSYEIIGKVAGYDVVAYRLWSLPNPPPSFIPSVHVFEIPEGSGVWYTDLEPRMPLYDEVAADFIPTDTFCWEDAGGGQTYGELIGANLQTMAVTGTSYNAVTEKWTITFTANGADDMDIIASAGYVTDTEVSGWYATFPGGDSGSFPLEDDPVHIGGLSYSIEVVGQPTLTVGATVSIDYECPIVVACWYCPASAIRVTIVPDEVLNEPESLLDDALARMVRKILLVVPIHVRLTQLTHIVGPVAAAVHVPVAPGPGHIYAEVASQQRSLFAYASVGYYFDIVEADAIETDPPHIAIANVTQYTVP
jgi:hypothetical protein